VSTVQVTARGYADRVDRRAELDEVVTISQLPNEPAVYAYIAAEDEVLMLPM
jgi:hypothetical protein